MWLQTQGQKLTLIGYYVVLRLYQGTLWPLNTPFFKVLLYLFVDYILAFLSKDTYKYTQSAQYGPHGGG